MRGEDAYERLREKRSWHWGRKGRKVIVVGGIYGGLDKNQRVNLLCRWKHEERELIS